MAQQSATASELVKEYELVVPWEQIATEAIAELKKIQRERVLPGFRPGKAPIGLLLRQFGSVIQENCAREKLQAIFDERLATDGLKLAAFLDVSLNKADWQGDSSFRIKFEVEPVIEPIEFTSMSYPSFEHKPIELSAEELEEELLKVKIANSGEHTESISGDGNYLRYGDLVYLNVYQQVSEPSNNAEDPLADSASAKELQRISELLGQEFEPGSVHWRTMANFEHMHFGMTNRRLEALVPGIKALAQEKEVEVTRDTIIKGPDSESCLKVKIIFAERCTNLEALDDAQVAKLGLPDIVNVEQLRAALTRSSQAQNQIDLYELESEASATSLYFCFRELTLPQSWLYNEANNKREQDIDRLMNSRHFKRSQAEQRVLSYDNYLMRAHSALLLQLVRTKYLEHYQSQLPEISDAEVDDYLQLHYYSSMNLTAKDLFGGKDKAGQLRSSKEMFDGYRNDPEQVAAIKQQLRGYQLAKLLVSQASALGSDDWHEFVNTSYKKLVEELGEQPAPQAEPQEQEDEDKAPA